MLKLSLAAFNSMLLSNDSQSSFRKPNSTEADKQITKK